MPFTFNFGGFNPGDFGQGGERPQRERKPRKPIGTPVTRTLINIAVTALVGLVYFYVELPALNPHAEEFYFFVFLLCAVYCGCAVLLFAGMYFFNKEIRIVEKIVLGLLIVLYFAGFHVTMLNLLFHGLHKPVGIPNRFAFVLVFLLLRVTSDAWGKISVQSRKWLFAGLAAEIFCVAVGILGGKNREILFFKRRTYPQLLLFFFFVN